MQVQFLTAIRNQHVRFALGQKTCASLANMIADAEQLARLGSDVFGERQFQTQATATAVRAVVAEAAPLPTVWPEAQPDGGADNGQVGQLIAAITQLSERQKQVQAEARCWNCKEIGHYQFQCPKERADPSQGGGKGKNNWKRNNKGKEGQKGANEKKDPATSNGKAPADAKAQADVKAVTATVKAEKPAENGEKT
jgi:hypothetical protein